MAKKKAAKKKAAKKQQFCYDEDRSDWIPPSSPLAREERDAARRHRGRYIDERNEVIAVLTRIWESHLMPPSGALATADQRMVVCIHSPAGLLCWPIDKDEIEPQFAHLTRLTEPHWDKSKAADRSERLQMLSSTPRLEPIPVIGTAPVPVDAAPPAEPRRPGEFHRPRTKVDAVGREGGKVTIEHR